jgi:hypothetical protein
MPKLEFRQLKEGFIIKEILAIGWSFTKLRIQAIGWSFTIIGV